MNVLAFIAGVALLSHCSNALDEQAQIKIVDARAPDGGDDEHVWVDLKRINPETRELQEETSLQVNLHFHLVEGMVHLNGHPCHHNIANAIHLDARINEYMADGGMNSRQEAVVVRVFVEDKNNLGGAGPRVFTVEEEVIAVGREEVTQVDVKQIVIEAGSEGNAEFKRSMLTLSIEESKLHAMTRDLDRHSGDLRPRLPETPLFADDNMAEPSLHHNHHNHHHKHHHHGHNTLAKISCWFHKLSLKSRIAIFVVLCLLAATICMCCQLCCKRRRQKRLVVKLMTDEDETINDMTVDMEEVKIEDFKKEMDNANGEFHFEMEDDHVVGVDDKKKLIE